MGRDKFDMCFKGRFPSEFSKRFREASEETVGGYQSLIEGVSRRNMESPDWWVSGPASRNTWAGDFFHNLSVLQFLRNLGEKELEGRSIVVDSPAMRKAVLTLIPGADVRIERPFLWRMKGLFNNVYAYWAVLCRMAAARLSGKRAAPKGPMTLVDTFVMPGFVDKDRYYPGMLEVLDDQKKSGIFFSPTWIGYKITKGVKFFRSLRNSTRKFVIKEDYLRASDIFYVFLHGFRRRRLDIGRLVFEGTDVTGIFMEDLGNPRHLYSSFEGLMNMRFARRLSEAGADVRLVIDWFENQSVDKGWNMGFNKYFPNAATKGYEGYFITDFYLCRFPAETEKEAGVIPKKIAVTGEKLVGHVKRFCGGLDVETAPAFRYSHVHEKRKPRAGGGDFVIFAGLPVLTEESLDILRMLDEALMDERFCDVKVIFKTHPGGNAGKIEEGFLKNCANSFERVSGSFGELLEKCDLYAGAASGTCLEAVARGCPAVVLDRQAGMSCPIPSGVDKNSWKLCENAEKLRDAVLYFKSMEDKRKDCFAETGAAIRRDYFEMATLESVHKFLEFGKN